MADKTVLVVDDSRVARMMTCAAVARLCPGWSIIEAATGEEALAATDAHCPDFVLMDVIMPGMGGLAAAAQLLQRWPGLRISLLTANIQEPIRRQAEEMGAGFMTKPLKDETLARFLAEGADTP